MVEVECEPNIHLCSPLPNFQWRCFPFFRYSWDYGPAALGLLYPPACDFSIPGMSTLPIAGTMSNIYVIVDLMRR